MKELTVVFFTLFAFLAIIWLPSRGEADVIYGCYHKKSRKLRTIKNNQKCGKSERPITLIEAGSMKDMFCVTESINGVVLASDMTAVGNGHYLLNGTHTNYSTTGIGSVSGNASEAENSIIMTLRESHTDESGMSISTHRINLKCFDIERDCSMNSSRLLKQF
jgi:hypothetical protein